ncbi:MAG: DUF6364 family protein [Thermoguttaceae bacterium]|jgi:hypothetical protein
MVNITLSAEDDLVAKARAYAQTHNTTLNQLIRDYLGRVTGQVNPQQAAEEFADLARNHGGRSNEGFTFDRRDAHVRRANTRRTDSPRANAPRADAPRADAPRADARGKDGSQ